MRVFGSPYPGKATARAALPKFQGFQSYLQCVHYFSESDLLLVFRIFNVRTDDDNDDDDDDDDDEDVELHVLGCRLTIIRDKP